MARGFVLAALALALAGFGGGCGGNSEPVVPPSQIAKAAFKSTHGPGYKYALTVDASAGGEDISAMAHGVIDSRNERGTLTMDIKGSTLHVLIDDPYIYVRTGDSGPWLRSRADVYQQSSSGLSGQATSDPSQIMQFLDSAESVKKLGSETLNGIPTTHYRAQVDFAKRLETVAPSERKKDEQFLKLLKASTGDTVLPIDVFIDGHKRVRRLAFDIDVCTTEGDVSVGLKFDFLSYGPQTVPGLPHGEEVRDDKSKSETSSTDLSQYSC